MSKRRAYTPEEEELLLKLKSEGKSYDEIALTVNRSRQAVALRIQRLLAKKNGKQQEHRSWTEEEVDKLYEYINMGMDAGTIASKLDRTKAAITIKTRKLGLSFRCANYKYSDEEIYNIEEDWCKGTLTLNQLARKYNRTPQAMKLLAMKCEFGPRKHPELLSLRDIQELLGISRGRASHLLDIGLKCTKKRVGRTKYYIDLYDLLKFMEAHPDLYDATKVDTCIFEYEKPEWFNIKYKQDMQLNTKNKYKEYTNEEDKLILSMYKSGKSFREIGNRLGRTDKSIRNRLSYISMGRIHPRFYTDEEIKIIRDNAPYDTVDELVVLLKNKRSKRSILYKCEELGIKYHLSKNKCKQRKEEDNNE